MAKTPKKSAASPAKAVPAGAKKPKQTAKGTKKNQVKAELAAEHEAFYQANKARIDAVLAKCVKHFEDDENDIVRAVARKLHDYYTAKRMGTPKGGLLRM